MTLTVLDASVVAAWFLPSRSTAAASRLLSEVGQRRLIAPHIFPVEVRSLLLKAERKGARIAQTEKALAFLEQARIEVFATEHPVLMRSAMGVARLEELSMYDALYLYLAQTERADLATRDKALVRAAQSTGVAVVDIND